ncbi:MAG: sugar transferase, partial [Actinomycetota bacterium]|nr:sugar transferase [Actinomycetota bacterium]
LYILIVFPLGATALLISRFVGHRVLARARRDGQAQNQVVVVGDPASCSQVVEAFRTERSHGHRIVGACVTQATSSLADLDVPVSVGLDDIDEVVHRLRADTVAITTGPSMSRELLEQLLYRLEGRGVDVLVAPSLADVAGSRISVRPVAGVPLMHLDEPELDGVHRLIKGTFDRAAAALGLVLLLPAIVPLWCLVRFTSEGPSIFMQARVGRNGRVFLVWKFRSMYPDAEARLAELAHLNEGGGPLFKMKNDPRITPIGRFLRKWSLDELPQLVNVLKGDMSLVGPRPPLPSEVAQYEGHSHRRLLVKPGITGLWQVSGRSDLDWEQTVRLDLAYVDGWSLGFDLSILARTVLAVVRSSGAY